jgi:hypothetical protein
VHHIVGVFQRARFFLFLRLALRQLQRQRPRRRYGRRHSRDNQLAG